MSDPQEGGTRRPLPRQKRDPFKWPSCQRQADSPKIRFLGYVWQYECPETTTFSQGRRRNLDSSADGVGSFH